MTCGHFVAAAAGLETAFTIDASRVTFGRGSLLEVGDRARALGMRRIALFTDRRFAAFPWVAEVEATLGRAGLEVAIYQDVVIEPTDASFEDAGRFAIEARVDGYVSLGGGSVIDTCKAANLLATHPAPLGAYLSAPFGDARAIPGPLRPHLACPTTSGTGSEVTGIAVCGVAARHAKTGIASPYLRPTEAVIDPRVTETLPAHVVAASGLDIMAHAIESYTARPFTQRAVTATRPASQGANPWSDLGCLEALRLVGRYLVRAVHDATDREARDQLMWAATLAGIAFGNSGVHVPHAMGYAIAGHARDLRPSDAPPDGISWAPHGFTVAFTVPAVVRGAYATAPGRHLEVARALGVDVRSASMDDGGAIVARHIRDLLIALGAPCGLGFGLDRDDVPMLVEATLVQHRLLANAPLEITRELLAAWFASAFDPSLEINDRT